jgi:hypothetical protein
MLGNGRLEAQCFDGTKRLAHIRGKLRKKVWINSGDIVGFPSSLGAELVLTSLIDSSLAPGLSR